MLQPRVSETINETSPRMLEMKLLSFIKHKVHDKIAKEKPNLNIFQLSDNFSITATITPSACQMLQVKIDSSTRKYVRRTQKEFNFLSSILLRWLLGWQQSETLLQKNSLPWVFVIGREAGCIQKSGNGNRSAAIMMKVSCISKCRKNNNQNIWENWGGGMGAVI